MQETRVLFLGWEDPLEKDIATHSSILAWKIPWMENPGSLQSMGSQRIGHDWVTSLSSLFIWPIGSSSLRGIILDTERDAMTCTPGRVVQSADQELSWGCQSVSPGFLHAGLSLWLCVVPQGILDDFKEVFWVLNVDSWIPWFLALEVKQHHVFIYVSKWVTEAAQFQEEGK